jgi:imidazolonepropionase-like amidohydrolase
MQQAYQVTRTGACDQSRRGLRPRDGDDLRGAPARGGEVGRAVAKIIVSGVRGVPGTGAGVTVGKAHGVYPHALTQLAESGMPTRDDLRSATTDAAEAVGRAGRKGVLRSCADADLLVVGSSPLDDMSAVTDIRAVYGAGHQVRCSRRASAAIGVAHPALITATDIEVLNGDYDARTLAGFCG